LLQLTPKEVSRDSTNMQRSDRKTPGRSVRRFNGLL
jgi:hypothetical protein